MAWPPTSNNAFNITGSGTGSTSLKWGTDGMYGSYIVKDISPADEVEKIYVENGTGLKSIRIMLFQGRKVDITVVDDSNITPPVIGALVNIVDSLASVAGTGVNTSFRVIDKNGKGARKVEGDLIISAEYLTNIEGAGTVPVGQ